MKKDFPYNKMKCWKDHCKNELEYACQCEIPPIYSCDLHANAHLNTLSKSNHHLEHIRISPNPETKIVLLDFLHKSLSDLYEIRRKAVHDFSIQIKQINDKMKITLKSFDRAIKEQRKLLSQINLISTTVSNNKTELDDILILEPEESIECLKDCFNIIDRSNFLIDETGKLKTMQTSLNEANRFILFYNSIKRIFEIDLTDFSKVDYDLLLEFPRSEYISMCLIPGNSVFCYGNYSTPTNIAFIIEPNNNVKHAADAPYSLSLSGSIYYNCCVYFFGGENGKIYTFKYFLSENKWEILNPMPAHSSCVSCFAQNNRILLSGREHSKIYCYDIIQNSYAELYNTIPAMRTWRNKIVLGNAKNAYVIEAGGNIYESNHEWKIWEVIGSSGIESLILIGYCLLLKNKVYFAVHTYDLYEFDLEEKKLQKKEIRW